MAPVERTVHEMPTTIRAPRTWPGIYVLGRTFPMVRCGTCKQSQKAQ